VFSSGGSRSLLLWGIVPFLLPEYILFSAVSLSLCTQGLVHIPESAHRYSRENSDLNVFVSIFTIHFNEKLCSQPERCSIRCKREHVISLGSDRNFQLRKPLESPRKAELVTPLQCTATRVT